MTAALVGPEEMTAHAAPLRRPLGSRLSAGHVVMAVAGLLGFLLTLSLVRAAGETVPVAVASSDLATGAKIDAASFRMVEMHADAAVLGTLIRRADLGSIEGRMMDHRVERGGLVRMSDLAPVDAGSAPRSMSFPIEAARAVGGEIGAGDRVDVVAASDGTARYVLAGVEVLAVDHGGGSGALRAQDDALTVSVALSPADAVSLAAVLEGSTVTLVRATGSEPIVGGLPSTAVIDAEAPAVKP